MPLLGANPINKYYCTLRKIFYNLKIRFFTNFSQVSFLVIKMVKMDKIKQFNIVTIFKLLQYYSPINSKDATALPADPLYFLPNCIEGVAPFFRKFTVFHCLEWAQCRIMAG